jgi:hypothetical protein
LYAPIGSEVASPAVACVAADNAVVGADVVVVDDVVAVVVVAVVIAVEIGADVVVELATAAEPAQNEAATVEVRVAAPEVGEAAEPRVRTVARVAAAGVV